ncbi:MAG: MotA/TolQ/ExbB proton channel family protein [Devosia sp.]|uniref:MotA/TolQ/ExbB proton channel family protein n=1 Tax=Devosia sp. TaxID=1871048 RepID=UPI001AC6521C|nr:MotA/TolQ/ExbB proton channel family protein [Devosia sp.]MBN9309927.1 MotA/TolQ/ExbB proton channel family protein [Devosia sp.]MBN9316653.1 MotA/TolQ/ExbB proton channel family protein [Devosia sp.]
MDDVKAAVIGSPMQVRDYAPVLRWLVVMGLVALLLLTLWQTGLLATVLESDHTRISLLIFGLFLITSLNALFHAVDVSRELIAARKARAVIEAESRTGFRLLGDKVLTGAGTLVEPGILASHVANLVRKADLGGAGRIDQTLLLRTVADRLRAREKLGLFVSEGLLRLALLGTAIGFILMLIPIAGLSSFDAETLRGALAGMTGGMAVALNVTVSGIAAALVLKFEYFQLDEAIGELFSTIAEVSEINVVPAIEKSHDGRA